jgi:aryl-alcohol dehydrogenase-like predicted oxidoreductase
MLFLLGTAQFGWQTDRNTAFALLDAWLQAGHRHLDTATNYPLNGQPDAFRAAERILEEYIKAHGLSTQLDITVKVGSMTNQRTPDINLSPSFVRMMADYYRQTLHDNVGCVMLHWDNRTEPAAIHDTLATLSELAREGIRPGLSGIAHPDVYAPVVHSFSTLKFDIQLKSNPLQSDWARYAPLHTSDHRWFAYGLTAGGVQLDQNYPDSSTLLTRGGQPTQWDTPLAHIRTALPDWNARVRPPVKAFWQLGLIHALYHEGLQGAVIGVRHAAQLHTTLEWLRDVEMYDYQDVANALNKLRK